MAEAKKTYARITLVMADAPDDPKTVLVGITDRIQAERALPGRGAEGGAEEWWAHCAWTAAKRAGITDEPFDSWVMRLIGMDFDTPTDGTDAPGEAPTPA